MTDEPQQTDTPPKPKRRRWRWLVAGLLFVGVFVVWYAFPSADDRFLGKWSTREGTTITFSRLGIVRMEGQKRTWHMRWAVEGNSLVLGGSEAAPRGSVKRWLLSLATKWSGDVILPSGRDVLEIISASPNRIHLVMRGQDGMPDNEQVLTR